MSFDGLSKPAFTIQEIYPCEKTERNPKQNEPGDSREQNDMWKYKRRNGAEALQQTQNTEDNAGEENKNERKMIVSKKRNDINRLGVISM